jgi:hypothetical protein
MFGSKPKQPKVPDPKVVSEAQTRSNQQTAQYEAALAHGNTTTPLGSQTFTSRRDPATGATVYDQTVSLDPRVQAQLDQQLSQNQQLGDATGAALSRVQDAYSQPMNTSGLPALRDAPTMQGYQQSVGTDGLPSLQGGYQNFYNTGQLPQMRSSAQGIETGGLPGLQGDYQSGFNPGGLPQLKTGYDSAYNTGALPQLQSQLNINGPGLQGSIDMNGLPELFGASDLEGARKQTQDALYNRSAGYLDPQWQQREDKFRTRMNNQGVVEGSEAWRNALDDENRARTFEYDQARSGAIAGGGEEMMRLASIASNNRGQTFGERTTAGNFTNSARNQAMVEAMNAGNFNNAARGQGFAEQGAMTADNANRAAFANTARGQAFGEQATMDDANARRAGFTNTARGQGFAEQAALSDVDFRNADLANRARGQGFAEQGAMTDEAANAAGFANTARGQGVAERFAQGDFANAATGAGNADALRAQAAGNAARSQGLSEMYTERAQPLNEFNALRNAAPIDMPQFNDPAATGVAPTDVAGNIWNAYGGQMDAYNAQMASRNGMFGSLGSLAGSLGSAWILSDERTKTDITPAGSLPDGTNVYDYYKGGAPERGVLAQEVERTNPRAVRTGKDGLKRVNYRAVMARAMEAA